MSIEAQNVSKFFGTFQALRDINLRIESGELIALLGPSGSGKTTLLRVIAGLENPDHGSVMFEGEDATHRHVRERRVGFVFQHYALFRHMTVFKNVAFGLQVAPRRTRPSRKEIRKRVMDLLGLVQLERLADRYPSQLSGGQRQRVALARALAVEPKVLLLDEPFGALDAKVRIELRRWLRKLHDQIPVTSIFVTHDQEEALEVADRVVVMNEGAIQQVGTPEEVYHHPHSPFVFNFLGNVNLFHSRIEDGKAVFGDMAVDLSREDYSDGDSATMYVRPYHLGIELEPHANGCFRAVVKHVNPAGPTVKVELESEWGTLVHAEISQHEYRSLRLAREQQVYLMPKDIKIFLNEGREDRTATLKSLVNGSG